NGELITNTSTGSGGGVTGSGGSTDGSGASSSTGIDISDAGDDGAKSDASDASDAQMMGICGDAIVETGEQCGDGNATRGDGCSGVCQIEPGYTCPEPGKPCIYTVTQTCGNGMIEGNEACDDGNTMDGDGCSAACQTEPGWSCSMPGKPCEMTGNNGV